jgi:hypothetical protein
MGIGHQSRAVQQNWAYHVQQRLMNGRCQQLPGSLLTPVSLPPYPGTAVSVMTDNGPEETMSFDVHWILHLKN